MSRDILPQKFFIIEQQPSGKTFAYALNDRRYNRAEFIDGRENTTRASTMRRYWIFDRRVVTKNAKSPETSNKNRARR